VTVAASGRIVLLDSFAIDQGEPDSAWSELAALGELVVYPNTEPAEVVSHARDALAVLTNKVELEAQDLKELPRLRYVGITATGTNIVDLGAAHAAGVAVTNVPGYATESVAELVLALILHFSFDVAGHNASVKAGVWAASSDFCFFRQPLTELAGKTLVLVGSGAIGGAVGRIAHAFGMRVMRAAVPGAPARSGARVPLPQALPAADFVSLHCPLTDRTRGMVDADFLARMKPGAILINTSRGPIVDEKALIAAVTAGKIVAALDVFDREPLPPNHPLRSLPNVVMTPHLGYGVKETWAGFYPQSVENALAFLDGKPVRVTNPEALGKAG